MFCQAIVVRPSSSHHCSRLSSGCRRHTIVVHCHQIVVRLLSSDRCCQAAVIRQSLSGSRRQAAVVMPLLGRCCQGVFVRLSSSGRCLQAVVVTPSLSVVVRSSLSGRHCQAVVVRPMLSDRRFQAVVVRPEEYESNVNHNMNKSVTRNLIGNAKISWPSYILSKLFSFADQIESFKKIFQNRRSMYKCF